MKREGGCETRIHRIMYYTLAKAGGINGLFYCFNSKTGSNDCIKIHYVGMTLRAIRHCKILYNILVVW